MQEEKSMMVYNMDFLIAALVFLSLILFHFMSQKRLENATSSIFRIFIVIGILDVLLDIFCTVLISWEREELAILTEAALTLLYFLQVLVPYAFVCYAKSLRVTSQAQAKKIIFFWAIPTCIMEILVIGNLWNGIFFSLDPQGIYIRGPFYLGMYGFAFFCVLVAMIDSIMYCKKLGIRKFITIWEFMIIALVCVAIQAYDNDILMTGFGLCLGITVLYLTIHNPYGYMDSLTGMFDKQYFEHWFLEQVEQDTRMHLISIDAYRLKNINKIMGNSVGDKMLVSIADLLQRISLSHQVFRIGSNRFLLVTNSLEEYERCRDEVQEFFYRMFEEDGERFRFPAIICGILDCDKLKECDTVLAYIEYLVSLVPETEDVTLVQGDDRTLEGFRYEQEIERFLNTAIEEDLFEVYYQPVFSIKTGDYVTLEALSRLRHPTFGMVPPEIFIDIAEKNRTIAQIGYLQFRKICRFIKENESMMGRIHNVKVNLSPLELLKTGHISSLIETIKQYELPFSYFQFEITETVATEYREELRIAISELANTGIGICLDDFGSGYANLNAVLKLPFSSIKLDRSLMEGICEDPQIALFYRNIVSIFQNMGFNVIAEGVETKEEVELLGKWGVDMIQGYYFSKPLSEQKILESLKQWKNGERKHE